MMKNRIKADWIAGTIIALLLSMQTVAIKATQMHAREESTSSGGSGTAEVSQETAFASAGEIILLAAVEIGIILLLWRGYKRLPEQWQARIRIVLKYGFISVLYLLGLLLYYPEQAIQYIVAVPVLYALYYIGKNYLSSNGLKWIAFNLIALSLGTFIIYAAGLNLSPRLVIVVMVAFMIYDHYAVHLSNIMSDFVELSSSTQFPNFLVVPTQLRVDLGKLHEFIQGKRDEKPEEIAVVVGLGDFIFPSVLVVSIFVAAEYSATVPLFTTVIGLCLSVLVLRASLERAESGLPALPYLNTGAMLGYVVGLSVVLLR